MRSLIETLRREAETTLRVFYAFWEFRRMVSVDKDVARINENPDFWILFESSFRTNMFIGIRRLFESESGTFNFQTFIEACEKSVYRFRPEELRQRKLAGSRNADEWIDDYMKNVYQPSIQDFRSLSKLVRQNSKKIKGPYLNAASKIYAHAVHTEHAEMVTISNDFNFEEIEAALVAIWHVYDQVWHMYENGKQPRLEIGKYPYADEVSSSVRLQLYGRET